MLPDKEGYTFWNMGAGRDCRYSMMLWVPKKGVVGPLWLGVLDNQTGDLVHEEPFEQSTSPDGTAFLNLPPMVSRFQQVVSQLLRNRS